MDKLLAGTMKYVCAICGALVAEDNRTPKDAVVLALCTSCSKESD